ncbi:MAG: TfoX/Sxy family protein [Spirosomataceae bacterium]
MAYDLKLADRIRRKLETLSNIEEKEMMGGLTFMYNEKMCVGIIGDELMCRIDPEKQAEALERHGCRIMDFTKRPMKGYVLIEEAGRRAESDFDYWLNLCLDFNSKAKSSKKKK